MASHALGDGGIPSRDATKKGLTRVMTLSGAYGTRNYTVKGLRDQGQRVLVETLPFSVEEAMAAEEAGIDTMKVRFDPNMPGPAADIRKAAPNTFIAFSVPLIAAASPKSSPSWIRRDGARCGRRHVPMGRFVELRRSRYPVQGHAGWYRASTWTGGLRAVGKTWMKPSGYTTRSRRLRMPVPMRSKSKSSPRNY